MNTSLPLPGVAVVGCGHWGKNLIRNFHGLGVLRGIFDTYPDHLSQQVAQYPGVQAFSRYEDVLADPAIQAVAIATPAETHASLAMQAFAAGKDAFVEKPLALYVEDGLAMVASAREHGRLLMVGHLLLYHPATQAIDRLLQSGELGKLEYIYSNRLSMGKIRQEENALWSFAPHDISVILRLTRHLPLQVTATGGAYLQPNIADVTVSNLLFEKGTRAHIFVSWLHPYKEQRLVVIGSKKMAVFEDSRPDHKVLLYDKLIERNALGIQASQAKGEPVPIDAAEPLRVECAHFVECVQTRRPPLTPGEDGVRVLEVLPACQRSLELSGAPVQLHAAAGVTAAADRKRSL